MPNQLDQPRASSAEGENGAAERILRKALLHQHRKPCHALAHISDPAGKIHTQA
jgi:hypothetical protein